jgi:hypothetical protein
VSNIAFAAAIVFASILEVAAAHADTERTASLSWVALPGAEACAGAASLAREVEERLHRRALFSASEADVSIEGRVEPVPSGGWHAVVELRDRRGVLLGTRTLDGVGTDCAELRKSVALAVALMIDPEAALHPAPPAPSEAAAPLATASAPAAMTSVPAPAPASVPPPASAAAPAPPPVAPPPSHPAPATPVASSTQYVRPIVDAEIGFGLLPDTAYGVRVGLTVKPRRFWDVEAYAGAWGSQTVTTPRATSTYFSLMFGGLATCPAALRSSGGFELLACAGPEVGSLAAASSGFSPSRAATHATVDAVASARAFVPLAPFIGLEARAEGALAVLRNSFVYNDPPGVPHAVFDRPLFNARLALGLAIDLP